MDSRNAYQNDPSVSRLIFATQGETAKPACSTNCSQTNIRLIEISSLRLETMRMAGDRDPLFLNNVCDSIRGHQEALKLMEVVLS